MIILGYSRCLFTKCVEAEFSEVRGYKDSLVAARIRLEGFAGGTFTARIARYRHSRYSEV
jgi:hypothetical protein